MVRPTRRRVGSACCADRRPRKGAWPPRGFTPVQGRNAFPRPQRSLRKGLRRYYAAQVGAARRPYHRDRHPPCVRAMPGYPHLNLGSGGGMEAQVETAAPAGRSHGRLSAIDYREAAGDFTDRTESEDDSGWFGWRAMQFAEFRLSSFRPRCTHACALINAPNSR